MEILSFVGIGILGALLSLLLRPLRPEAALLTALATGIVLLLLIAGQMSGTLDAISALAGEYGIHSDFLVLLVKIIGIAYLAQFGAQICKDAGESAVASKVELGGRVLIVALALPAALTALGTVTHLLGEVMP